MPPSAKGAKEPQKQASLGETRSGAESAPALPPPLPDDVPAIQQLAANMTHWGLYALLIVQPVVGWIATSAYRAPVLVFWLFELRPIWPVDQAFSERVFGLQDRKSTRLNSSHRT